MNPTHVPKWPMYAVEVRDDVDDRAFTFFMRTTIGPDRGEVVASRSFDQFAVLSMPPLAWQKTVDRVWDELYRRLAEEIDRKIQ